MATQTHPQRTPYFGSHKMQRQAQGFGMAAFMTLLACLLLTGYLMPFVYMALTSLKDRDQIVASAKGSILPMDPITYTYEGPDIDGYTLEVDGKPEDYNVKLASGDALEVYKVPFGDETRELAMVFPSRTESLFIDPENPDDGLIRWEGPRARLTLPLAMEFAPRTGNYKRAWDLADFPRLIFNTAFIAVVGGLGTLMSSICVAYAFARFPLPGKRLLFLILIATIILPRQVLLVPMFAFFDRIGWTGTWLPLIVPHFFANAYNVFLFRQYFLGLPRELDEAAMIDGAGPFQILLRIIIPQSWPVIVAVGLFHLVFAWNDYFEPLIYTLGHPELQPIAVGIQIFNFRYDQQPQLIQSTALLGMAIPVLLFFFAQRFFMRGVVITGVDK